MIIWDGIKLRLKKKLHAPVKDRVCADGSFWQVACSENNLRGIYIYIKILLKHLKKREKWNSFEICKRKQR